MSEIWNLSALCRCCHADGNFKNLQMPYWHGNTIEVYSNMLRECLGVSIVPPPIEASYSICDACIDKLRDSNNFRKQVLECEQKFLIYCQNEASVNPNVAIKLEPDENVEIKHLDKVNVDGVSKYDQTGYDPGQSFNSDDCKEETSDYFDRDHDDDRNSQDIKTEPDAKVKREDADTKKTKQKVKTTTKPKVKTHRQRGYIKKETRMFCAVCNEIFHKKVDVDNHVKSKHEPPIQCTECFKSYQDYSEFKRHVTDGCRRRFQCQFCDKSYNTYPAVLAHENSVHTKKSYFQCDICQKQFGYKSVLRKHILYHLGLQKTCACSLCGHEFNDRANLRIHIMNVHEKIRRFACDICEKKFSLKKHLKKHLIRHQGEKQQQCPDCPKKFYDAYDLRSHIRSVHGKDPVADQKSKVLGDDMPKVYNCPACEKKFYHRGLYARHLKKHRDKGALPYTCEICGKNFAGKYVLNRHIDSHTKITIRKKFPCAICQKDFCTKASLERHAKVIHDPDNDRFAHKVKCPVCKVHVKNLERHQKRHQFRPHACTLCSKTYPERNALNRHVKHIHLGVKLHCCQICGKEYTRPDVLKTHIKRKHYNNQIVLKVEHENYENDVPAFAIEISS